MPSCWCATSSCDYHKNLDHEIETDDVVLSPRLPPGDYHKNLDHEIETERIGSYMGKYLCDYHKNLDHEIETTKANVSRPNRE